ncbi:hypothetical protein, partial [Enterobacter hormaechei]|uniref:hypothetical protein n=1 Tax=Enterobacter hormaechei TaxID=158836 RepID=UPI001A9C817D
RPKTHLEPAPYGWFFMSIFCTGNHWGKTGEKYRQKIRHNQLIATDPFVRLYHHATFSHCPILSV